MGYFRGKLRSFHRRAIRHITGKHIRKISDGECDYPNHSELMFRGGLFPIEKDIERRRGNSRRYLEENRKELTEETKKVGNHCKDANKILWWKQKYYPRG